MQRGTQVKNKSTEEYGFITSVKGKTMFVRYWSLDDNFRLRTQANSEATPLKDLEKYNLHDQLFVEKVLQQLDS
ncbi:MAG: hypothetical protein KDH96_04000 [Candidatus Riesia sp.]|nr:hypothetical protein [Candidatus Riesia sp.]